VPGGAALRLCVERIQSPVEFRNLFCGEIDRRRFVPDAVAEEQMMKDVLRQDLSDYL
jgi:hypothetical protein